MYNIFYCLEMGVPPNEYIIKQKIKKSKEIMATQKISNTHLAYDLGFSTSSYFATVFKKYEGITPTNYRKRLLNV